MTQRLKSQINRLKQLEEYKSDFIQNVSHEIKTPITAINSAIELLELKNNINEQDKECYEIIVHQSKMLNSLVNDILSLSEIEVEKTGEHKNFKRFALNEVIESIINYTIHNDIKINLINKDIINIMNLSYFKIDNLKRYLDYDIMEIKSIYDISNIKKDFNYEDVVTYVNANLDKEYYSSDNLISNEDASKIDVLVNKYHKLDENYVEETLNQEQPENNNIYEIMIESDTSKTDVINAQCF